MGTPRFDAFAFGGLNKPLFGAGGAPLICEEEEICCDTPPVCDSSLGTLLDLPGRSVEMEIPLSMGGGCTAYGASRIIPFNAFIGGPIEWRWHATSSVECLFLVANMQYRVSLFCEDADTVRIEAKTICTAQVAGNVNWELTMSTAAFVAAIGTPISLTYVSGTWVPCNVSACEVTF